jgi:hypothetical protein
MRWSSGAVYSGAFSSGRPGGGEGRLACTAPEGFSSGATFEGEFVGGAAHGKGVFSFPEHEGRGGCSAEGCWEAGALAPPEGPAAGGGGGAVTPSALPRIAVPDSPGVREALLMRHMKKGYYGGR